jgi:hypothetical protein
MQLLPSIFAGFLSFYYLKERRGIYLLKSLLPNDTPKSFMQCFSFHFSYSAIFYKIITSFQPKTKQAPTPVVHDSLNQQKYFRIQSIERHG